MKKLLALFLTAVMLLTMVSVLAVAEERKEFTFWAAYNPTYQLDWEGMKCWKLLEEKTGIHINWVLYANSGEMKEKLGVLLGTNDVEHFPDAFFRSSISDAQLKKYGPEGQFMDVYDLVKEYAPNACARIDAANAWSRVRDPESGAMYSMPSVSIGAATNSYKLFLNKKMMEAVGVTKTPTTLQELYDLMVLVRDQDANGNGDLGDEVGLVTNNLDRYTWCFAGAFGLLNRGRSDMLFDADPADNTKVRFTYTAPEYRELLAFLNKLYEEKLVDQKILTPSTANMVALGSQNQLFGIFYVNINAASVKIDDYTYITEALEGPHGDKAWNTAGSPVGVGNFVISNTVSREDAITLVKWADFLYTDEGATAIYYGEEGVDFYYDEKGYPQFMPEFLAQVSTDNPYDKVLSAVTCYASGGVPGYKDDKLYCGAEVRGLSLDAGLAIYPDVNTEAWSFNFTTEENEEVSALKTDLITNCHNVYRAKFINGELDVDDDAVWQQYIDEISAGDGLKDLTYYYQTALDRMLAE